MGCSVQAVATRDNPQAEGSDVWARPGLPRDRAGTRHQRMGDPARALSQIAEVEELVEPGQIEPDQVHTPGIYVARIMKSGKLEKPIEQRTVRKRVA